ncbi:hypothetical protein PILCRDRAFT_7825 [Piloderma croceum F 1598]|uniref:Uncharacterized protein n=1 Tax=Piloderma croceum (strain F 1598) TaxID=765440 RepID=A0A0C3FCN0_PILCF|nr:hypothetical protein PILCRDRAFT_7825 [Piloderma croceum F 1598]
MLGAAVEDSVEGGDKGTPHTTPSESTSPEPHSSSSSPSPSPSSPLLSSTSSHFRSVSGVGVGGLRCLYRIGAIPDTGASLAVEVGPLLPFPFPKNPLFLLLLRLLLRLRLCASITPHRLRRRPPSHTHYHHHPTTLTTNSQPPNLSRDKMSPPHHDPSSFPPGSSLPPSLLPTAIFISHTPLRKSNHKPRPEPPNDNTSAKRPSRTVRWYYV